MKNKALLIDDDPDFRASLECFFTETGYDVITADKGENGFTKAVEERPDLIVLDVMMEDCSAGLDTVRKLRDHSDTAKIPVFMVTGIRKPQHLLESYAQNETFPNVQGIFEKPVPPEKFVEAIKALP